MRWKHRAVHLISLIALIISLFSPLLSLPVTADEPVPEPEIVVDSGESENPTGDTTDQPDPETGDSGDDTGEGADTQVPGDGTGEGADTQVPGDGTGEGADTQEPGDGADTQVPGDGTGGGADTQVPGDGADPQEPSGEPVDGDIPEDDVPSAPVLTPVTPALPTVAIATCGEGVIFAETATGAVTEGITYTLGAPDTSGTYVITATLTDTALYTWAENGLDGWTVTGDVATTTDTLALCPVPEPVAEESPAVPDDSTADASELDKDEEASADSGDADGIDEEEDAEEIAAPTTGRGPARETNQTQGTNMRAAAATELEISMTANITSGVTVGNSITYTISVANNTGMDQHYSLVDTLPAGVTYESHTVPYPLDGDYCNPGGGVVNCGLADGMVLYPGWVDQWTITVTVNTASCGSPLVNTVTGSWAEPNTASVSSDVLCPEPKLQIEVTDGLAPGQAAMPGTTLTYTIFVDNLGETPTTISKFESSPIPYIGSGITSAILFAPSSICSVPYFGGSPMYCDIVDVSLQPGATHRFTLRIELGMFPSSEMCSEGLHFPFTVKDASGTILATTNGIHTPINCSLLTIETQGPVTIEPGVPFDYQIVVQNTGIQISGDYAFEFQLPPGLVLSGALNSACTQDPATTVITCSGQGVPNGSTQSFPITVVTNPAACSVQIATATGTVGMWKESGRSDSLELEVTGECNSDLVLTVTADKAVVNPGEYVTFTYTQTSPTSSFPNSVFESQHDGESILYNYMFGEYKGLACWLNPATSHIFDCVPRGSLPVSEARYIQLIGTVIENPTENTCRNGISANATLGEGAWAPPAAHTLTATVQVNCQDLSISKGVSATSVAEGEEFIYYITVTNNGLNNHGGYSFTDTLPAGIELVDANAVLSQEGVTCTPTLANGITTIECQSEAGPDADGGRHDVMIRVKANYNLSNDVCGAVTNTVTGTVGLWTTATAEATTTIECAPLLTLGIVANETEVEPGDTIEYTITVTNNGSATEDRYLFWDALPADTRLTDPDYTMPAGAHCHQNTTGSQNFDCEGYNLAPGDTHTYIYRATVSTSASPTMCQGLNTWLRGAANPDYGIWDAASIEPTGIIHPVTLLCPALSIQKTDNVEESIGLNEPFTYSITVTNSGESAIGNFTVIDYLPAGIILTGELDARCETGTSGTQTTVTCADTSVPLEPGNSNTFVLNVMAVEANDAVACEGVENMVSGDRGIWVPGEQTAFVSTAIDCVSELTVTKEPLSPVVIPGETIGYEIVVRNSGNTTITTGTVTDDVPVLPEGGEWAYSVNGTPVDSSPFPYTITDLPGGESITFRMESNEIPPDLQVLETEWCINWSNTVTVEAVSSTGADLDGSQSATVQVTCTGLSIEKTVSAERIAPGGQVIYKITVTNHGNAVALLVPVLDDLTEANTVFSNWQISAVGGDVTGEFEPICQYFESDPFDQIGPGGYGCITLGLLPQESIVVTITGDAPTMPTWEQCAPVENTAWSYYIVGVPAPEMVLQAQLTPPLEKIYSNTVTTQLDCQPGIEIEKTGALDAGADGIANPGDEITYTFEVENTGNVSLYDIVVTDDMDGLSWESDPIITELLPEGTETFTATYEITQADIDAGLVENTAIITGYPVPAGDDDASEGEPVLFVAPEVTAITDDVTAVTDIEQLPVVEMTKTGTANAGDDDELNLNETIAYTFTVTNTGNVTLTGLQIVDDMDGVTVSDSGAITTLAPGAEATLTATYSITQADVDSGLIVNCADVTATAPDGSEIADRDSCATNLIDQNPSLLVAQVCPGPSDSFLPNVGDEVTYEITISNNGDQTIHEVVVSTNREGTFASAFPTELAPGQSETREWTTVVTDADYAAREITLETTVSGETAAGESAELVSMVLMQVDNTVTNTIMLSCPMGVIPVTPEPATPEPATPEPTTPAPATPEPATPAPSTPNPATPEPTGTTAAVTGLPETGGGTALGATGLLWIAAMLSVVVLGAGAIGIRRRA